MPNPRRDRETAPVAVSWALENGMPPPEGKAHNPRGGKPVTRRNGLPEFVPYLTDEIRAYYAAQGIVLRGARAYFGNGRDTLTGHLTDDQLEQETGHA